MGPLTPTDLASAPTAETATSATPTAGGRRRVVVVAEGRPTRGGVASFAETIVDDPEINRRFDIDYLNTARQATRPGGKLVWRNATAAASDAVRTFRAARRAEVVHLQLMGEPGLSLVRAAALCLAGRLAGARVIAHNHSATGNAGRPDISAYGSADRALLYSLRCAHLVLMVADPGVDTMTELIHHPDVRRMDNATDIAEFPLVDRTGRGVPVVTFVGTICRRKGVHDLIAAARRLAEEGAEWRLRIVGGQAWTSDEEYAELIEMAGAAGFADSFTGQLDAAGVRAALADSDIFVLPSYFEGQPVSIIEAQACGLPVVGTDIGAVPYQVRDGVEGRIVSAGGVDELTAALRALIVDPALRRQMGDAARARAEDTFDLTKLRDHLTSVYSEPLPRRARRRFKARA